MKLLVVLMACALVAAATPVKFEDINFDMIQDGAEISQEERSLILNMLIRQLFELFRRVIRNGSWLLGIPVLDPLVVDQYHLVLPAGLLNLDVNVTNGLLEGLGDFVVHRSNFVRSDISFEVEMSIPVIKIKADNYKLAGDFFTTIPLYGDGVALFEVENFRVGGVFYLKQSEDEKSILIDRIENPSYSIGSIKSGLTGVIGGGDIDGIINSIVEEVILSYSNRLHRSIAKVVSRALVEVLNPMLDQLDSWRYIQLVL